MLISSDQYCYSSSSSKSTGASSLPLITIYMDELQQKLGESNNELQQKFDHSLKIYQNTPSNSRDKTLFYRRKIPFV